MLSSLRGREVTSKGSKTAGAVIREMSFMVIKVRVLFK